MYAIRSYYAGGTLYKSADPEQTARDIITGLATGKPVKTDKFKKFNESELGSAFNVVSTSNISDAMHRTGEMRGLKPVWNSEKPLKFAGPAVTRITSYNVCYTKLLRTQDHTFSFYEERYINCPILELSTLVETD